MSSPSPIKIGILMIPYQTLDVAGPLDVLASCSKTIIDSLPADAIPGTPLEGLHGLDVEFLHVNETMEPVQLTAGFKVLPTTTTDTCPPLDYLLIGGPDPFAFSLSPAFSAFIQKHVAGGGSLFCTCTGALAISSSGVLDGIEATTNHMALPLAQMKRPEVKWVKEQWVEGRLKEGGSVWTAGGACAGMDMMAHWLRSTYGPELARLSSMSLDFEPRDRKGVVVQKDW